MARFRGTIKGNRGEASRLGTADSGLEASANGWNIGGEVRVQAHNNLDNVDVASLYLTGGSNNRKVARFDIGMTVIQDSNGDIRVTAQLPYGSIQQMDDGSIIIQSIVRSES